MVSLGSGRPTAAAKDWRDYAGRSLRRCAQELRANRAEKVLAERLAPQVRPMHIQSSMQYSCLSGPSPWNIVRR